MGKKRVSLYIDEELFGEIKEQSWKRRESASAYFEKLVRSGLNSFTDFPKEFKIGRDEVPDPVQGGLSESELAVLTKAKGNAEKIRAKAIKEREVMNQFGQARKPMPKGGAK